MDNITSASAIIVPAILEQTLQGFEDKLNLLRELPGLRIVQIDFCHKDFVGSDSLKIADVPLNLLKKFKKISFEAHVMGNEPSNFIDYKNAGFAKIIVHYESFASETELDDCLEHIKKLGMKACVAINPSTPVSVLTYIADNIDNFLIMSVEPGQQGREFLIQTLDKVDQLRQLAPNCVIEVDGGVNENNLPKLRNASVNLFASGSGMFNGNLQQNWQKFSQLLA